MHNNNANTYGRIIVEIDPDGQIADFNRHSNRLEPDDALSAAQEN
jgi:hypothetical protein